MELVVDTSVVFSLFKSDSFTNKLLKEYDLTLFAPEELIEELSKYSEIICAKSKIAKEKFSEDVSLLSKFIELKNSPRSFEDKADGLISHKTDVPFLALALELNIPIWSNDPHFKEQSSVEVFTTKELVDKLKLLGHKFSTFS
ncbi:PIN domain-containing protein [Candidatus Pacearchaeota archaeon]|nr:PIN domain-containing protein [Candidatus Pacearchaeota archaeon]